MAEEEKTLLSELMGNLCLSQAHYMQINDDFSDNESKETTLI